MPAGGVRAARRGGRDAREAQRAGATSSRSCSPARRWRSSSRTTRRRCGAGATGSTRRVSGVRGARCRGDVVVPRRAAEEGLERFEAIATSHGLRSCAWGHGGDGNVHATVLVDPARRAELDAAEAVSEELYALVARARRLDRGRARRRLAEARAAGGAVGRARGGAARADQARVRPEGAAQPGQEARAAARRRQAASPEQSNWLGRDGAGGELELPTFDHTDPRDARRALPRGDGASCASRAGSRRCPSATWCWTARRASSSCARARRSSRG